MTRDFALGLLPGGSVGAALAVVAAIHLPDWGSLSTDASVALGAALALLGMWINGMIYMRLAS